MATARKKLWDKLTIKAATEEHAKLALELSEYKGVKLEGSKKQISWAESIRGEAKQKMIELTASGAMKGTAEQIISCISSPSAKWWIDNRNNF